jgi:8-amino-7-oxononanoate synthase
MVANNIPIHLLKALEERKQNGIYRELHTDFPVVDFCSNDYLGFSKLGIVSNNLFSLTENDLNFGSGGSRLISGNSKLIEETENKIALFHNAAKALIYNSGYDANIGLISSVCQKEDLILFDELCHASIYDGMKLSYAKHYKFKHNDIESLSDLIKRHHQNYKNIYVIVESVYSMDGDNSPLIEITELIQTFDNLFLIVDEAHAVGVFGKNGEGLCQQLGIEQKCFARVYTYGKAMGCHGAAVVGCETLRNYLINFSRSFIYTTALPGHSINAILQTYHMLPANNQMVQLQNNIAYFISQSSGIKNLIKSKSAIQSVVVGTNEKADWLQASLAKNNIYAKAIKSPTVKVGSERIRICIHAFNTLSEIDLLLEIISEF